ncbi:putative ammonium permease ATO2 [Sugiyamaella lignohabitans]|uniref:Putative ammonium permease ATO2 n=1 Tax=Sugiyamaella lignohabitans TaxID=796027 RepID=A0A167FZU3_9ASCO|nr:putative ammonium permease ATO2 [Sugiyamaella lignohabitans]ANB15918.1 putative ammonium permease ATO2 [Sugiyamaella lignohabitans]
MSDIEANPTASTIKPPYGAEHGEDTNHAVARIITSGDDNEFIHIGNTKVYRDELIAAFGGTLNPSLHAAPSRKFANPSPLGLCAFALTTFVLSLVNVQARGVQTQNIVVGLAFFYGGAIQLLAGMWEMVVENTFGATALSSYGGFWMSFGAILTPSFGILDAYTDPKDLESALGFYLIGWFIFTFLMLLCTIRSTVAFFSLFFFLDVTFILLAAGNFSGHVGVTKAGGWFGIITAFIAWYNALAGVATKENSWLTFKPIFMPGAQRIEKKSKSQ